MCYDMSGWKHTTRRYHPPTPYLPECMSHYMRQSDVRDLVSSRHRWKILRLLFKNMPLKISQIREPAHSYPWGHIVGYKERLYKYFEIAPKHNLAVGDLVTCTCHGGIAMVIKLHDKNPEHPSMDMAQIYWLKYPHAGVKERVWVHTISRLRKWIW